MLASVLVEPGVIELRDVDTPTAGPGEVVVKIRAALTCGTDLKAFRRGHPLMPMPTLFGHEFAGEIVEVGPGVDVFAVGDRVMSVHTAPCGSCELCRRGLGNLCDSTMESKVLGAYAEYLRVPGPVVRNGMFLKPDHLTYESAAILEPLSCVVYGMEQVTVRPDDTVVIVGAGAIGLLHLMVVRAKGARRVIVSGHRPYRLALAREIGADVVIDSASENAVERVREETSGRGGHLVIECTGQPPVWEEAVRMVARGGTVVLFGGCPKGTTVTFDTARLHYDQITLKGAFHFTPDAVRSAYRLLVERRIDVRPLITGAFPLRDLPAVFQRLMTGDCIKYAIVP
ncbi:MAG: zinc-binding dehydrogenase [Candidatus Latescibacteria bacterium]|nr:zinc-binding dehydrogenase [Candidatus Latescibacterota bacterium]